MEANCTSFAPIAPACPVNRLMLRANVSRGSDWTSFTTNTTPKVGVLKLTGSKCLAWIIKRMLELISQYVAHARNQMLILANCIALAAATLPMPDHPANQSAVWLKRKGTWRLTLYFTDKKRKMCYLYLPKHVVKRSPTAIFACFHTSHGHQ